MDGHRQEAPHLLEEVYNLEDALLVGGLINSLTAQCRSSKTRLPRAVGQRDRSDHDGRERNPAADDLLSIQLGAAICQRRGAESAGGVLHL